MHGMQRLMLGLALATAGSATADPAARTYDINRPAWQGGEIVQVFARIPMPGSGLAASLERKDETVYLIGHVFERTPFSSDLTLPDGRTVIPAHDDVFIPRAANEQPFDGFGRWVVAGKQAVSDPQQPNWNVRVRAMPTNSVVGQPLAYAVRMDGQWLWLTDVRVIERALAAELIATTEKGIEGFGGVGWTQPALKRRVEE